MRTLVASAMVVLASFVVGSAKADAKPAQDTSKNVEVMVFEDDKLLHSNVAPGTEKIGAGHKPVRTLITRPRTHFVPELLASIERL